MACRTRWVFLKGKSAVRIHRELLHERQMSGLHSWTTVYWVSTVGWDEALVRGYIRTQKVRNRQQMIVVKIADKHLASTPPNVEIL